MLHRFIYRVHSLLSRSSWIAFVAAKTRNQLNHVIGLHLGPTPDARYNGEFFILERLAPNCSLFVDVGANVGDWSERCLSVASGRVVVYEPSSAACQSLRQRLTQDRVEVHQCAVGDKVGEVYFNEDVEKAQTSFVTELRSSGENIRAIRATTLDREFLDTDTRIDFLKIDAEGYDLKILQGAEGLLTNRRVRYVQFEYNSFWLRTGSSLMVAINFLEKHDYCVSLITPRGLRPHGYDLWGDFFFYSNFFACHRDDVAGVLGMLK